MGALRGSRGRCVAEPGRQRSHTRRARSTRPRAWRPVAWTCWRGRSPMPSRPLRASPGDRHHYRTGRVFSRCWRGRARELARTGTLSLPGQFGDVQAGGSSTADTPQERVRAGLSEQELPPHTEMEKRNPGRRGSGEASRPADREARRSKQRDQAIALAVARVRAGLEAQEVEKPGKRPRPSKCARLRSASGMRLTEAGEGLFDIGDSLNARPGQRRAELEHAGRRGIRRRAPRHVSQYRRRCVRRDAGREGLSLT